MKCTTVCILAAMLMALTCQSAEVESPTFDMSMQGIFELKKRSLRYSWSEIHPDVWNSNVEKEEMPLQQVVNQHLVDRYEINIKLSDAELTEFKTMVDEFKLRSVTNTHDKELVASGRRHSMVYHTTISRGGKKHEFSFNASSKVPDNVVEAYDAYRVLIKKIIKKRISRHLDKN